MNYDAVTYKCHSILYFNGLLGTGSVAHGLLGTGSVAQKSAQSPINRTYDVDNRGVLGDLTLWGRVCFKPLVEYKISNIWLYFLTFVL